jgi:hypothetical protein
MAATQSQGSGPGAPYGTAGYFIFDEKRPYDDTDGARSWYARAENFIAVYSNAEAGAKLSRIGQPDEYAVLLAEASTRVTIEWNGETTTVEGFSLAFVPAGDSTVTVEAGGPVVRLITRRSEDLVARCDALYPDREPDTNVPALENWPDPVGGFKVRAYSLDVPQVEGRFGRIFRCTTIMVNFLYPRMGPRDRTMLSPHSHDDFQQISLCLGGTYTHHIRWPWDTDANNWRDDDHVTVGAPSVTVIPAAALHTSECTGPGKNQLVDIFCPPRVDFSVQPGWILNADDYPLPDGVEPKTT